MLVQILSGGRYKPNEEAWLQPVSHTCQASGYDHEAVIAEVSKQRQLLVEEPCGQPIEGNEAFSQIIL